MRAAVLLLPLILLTGCFDYAEDLWIHPNRSAELKMVWGLHEELVEDPTELRANLEELAAQLEQLDEVTHTEVEDWKDGEMVRASLLLGVTHYKHLEAIFDEACAHDDGLIPADDGAGKTWEFKELEDGSLQVTRHPDSNGDGKAGNYALSLGELDEDNPLRGRAIAFRIHAAEVFEADEAGAIDGGTVAWEFPLEEHMLFPRQVRARVGVSSPFPWALALGGAFGLGGLLWLRKKWERRWE